MIENMQYLFHTSWTCEQYTEKEGWNCIRIERCPIHPDQDCRIRHHGTYDRVFPPGTKISRFFCHTEKIIFSMLPSCFSSRFPGSLIAFEMAVSMVEGAVKQNESFTEEVLVNKKIGLSSLDLASAAERLNIPLEIHDLATDMRWLKRRIDYAIKILSVMIMLYPELFGNCIPTLSSFRLVLGSKPIFFRLRSIAESKLHEISKPVGLNPCHSRLQEMVRRPKTPVI